MDTDAFGDLGCRTSTQKMYGPSQLSAEWLVACLLLSMGSALLRNPENVRDILTTLRRNLTIPVRSNALQAHGPRPT